MNIATLYQLYQQYPVVTTDSRNCPAGSIFIALKGENFNGNAFAAQSLEKGCAYAIVDEKKFADEKDKRIIVVDNCLKTLQQLANYHRKQLGTKIIGITGTNGKTTTKELISAVLSQKYHVLYTLGNLNNHIGVPLTLLRLTAKHDLAVIEMGASHPGDIKELAEIAEPDYGIITNVGKAHLEGFGSFQGVIQTKGELYDFLRKKENTTVFIHQENPYLNNIAQGLNLISYGQEDSLFVNGGVTSCSPLLAFRWKNGKNGEWHQVQTQLIGSYNLDNALAAATIGCFLGVDPRKIDYALGEYAPQNNRSQLKDTGNNRLIIDAYNANPTSMTAALNNFKDIKATRKTVILGDMKELGPTSIIEHQRIVDLLEEYHFDKVILVGDQFAATKHSQQVLPDVNAVIEYLKANKPHGEYILIKGSNSMKLANTVNYL